MKYNIIIFLLNTVALSACSVFDDDSNETISLINQNTQKINDVERKFNSNFIVEDRSYIVDVNDKDFVLGEELWPKNKISITTVNPISIKKALEYIFDKMDYNIRYVDIVNGNENTPETKKNITFSGDLKSYIRFLEHTFDVNIESEGDSLVVSFYERKHYKLAILSDAFKSQGGFSSGSSSGSNSSSAVTVSNTYNSENAFWEEFQPYLKTVVTDGHYLLMSELATLVVVTRPSMQRVIESVLESAENISSGQVIINYKIYELDKDKLSSLAAELNIDTKTSGGLNILSKLTAITGGKGQGVVELTQEGDGKLGLQAVLEKTSTNIVSEGEINTLTNRVVPLTIATETAYVSSVERQVSGSDGQQSFSTVVPETISTGMSLMFLPRIMANNRVQLETGFSRSTLSNIENFEGLVQLPIVNRSEGITTNLLRENTPTLVQLFEEKKNSNFNRAGIFGISHNPQVKSKLLAVIVSVRVDRI